MTGHIVRDVSGSSLAHATGCLPVNVLKAVVLEIGAGDRVPTVRREAEHATRMWRMSGAETTLVRVNPDIPYGDHAQLCPEGLWADSVISILGRGLEVLEKIDAVMPSSML